MGCGWPPSVPLAGFVTRLPVRLPFTCPYKRAPQARLDAAGLRERGVRGLAFSSFYQTGAGSSSGRSGDNETFSGT